MKLGKVLFSLLLLALILFTLVAPAEVQADGSIPAHPYLTIATGFQNCSVGLIQGYTATWHNPGFSDKDVTNACVWYVDDSSVATVVLKGAVKGIAVGTTKVHAYYDIGNTNINSAKYAAADMTVEEFPLLIMDSHELRTKAGPDIRAHLDVTPLTPQIYGGDIITFKAIWSNPGDTDKDVTSDCLWYTDDDNIAYFTSDGKLIGKAKGKTMIHAYYNWSGSNYYAYLTVDSPSLSIVPDSCSGNVGDTLLYKANLHYSDGRPDKDVTNACLWYLDDNSIAKLVLKGSVVGKLPGTTKIHVNYDPAVISAAATVIFDNMSNKASTPSLPQNLTSSSPQMTESTPIIISSSDGPYLSVTPNTKTAKVGETLTFKAIWHETGSPDKDVTGSCMWYPSNNKIADVNSNGTAQSKAAGNTRVCAYYDQGNTTNALKYASADLTVYPSKYLTVTPDTQNVIVGESVTFKAIWHEDGSPDKDVTNDTVWYLTSYKIADVTSQGGVQGKAVGTTKVCAYYDQGNTDNFAKYDSANLTVKSPMQGGSTTPIVSSTMTSIKSAPALKSGPAVIQFTIGSAEYAVNGKSYSMDASPVISEGRTLLPIRYVAAPLGASVDWKADDQKVTVSLNGKTIELWIDQNSASVNGASSPIDSSNSDVAPIVVPPGRTMLPLRFIAEQLGCQVDWDQAQQVITVTHHSS